MADPYYLISTPKLAPTSVFKSQTSIIREIDVNVPYMYGETKMMIGRLQKNRIICDSYHHTNKSIR